MVGFPFSTFCLLPFAVGKSAPFPWKVGIPSDEGNGPRKSICPGNWWNAFLMHFFRVNFNHDFQGRRVNCVFPAGRDSCLLSVLLTDVSIAPRTVAGM